MKKVCSILLSVVLLFGVFQLSVHGAVDVEVNTVQELKDAAELATDDSTITLGSSFPSTLSATIALNITHNYNVTIIGNGVVFQPMATNVRHITIADSGSGVVTLDGMAFIGKNTVSGDTLTVGAAGGGLSLGAGKYAIKNSQFSNINGSAVVGTGNTVRSVEVSDTTFDFNSNTGAGGALNFDNGNGSLTVTNTTFYKNKSDALGYSGGAISYKSGKSLVIENSYFDGNTTKHLGGAIAFHFPQQGATFSINNSYFKDNATLNPNNTAYGSYADGGAIGVYTDNAAIAFSLTNTTFNGNSSYDDGGALMLQNYYAGSTNVLTNNTFYGNTANGLGVSADPKFDAGGGAIQFSKATNATLENNTFVKNTASGVNAEAANFGGARGGAIGFHYDTGAVKVYPTLNMKNNLLFGNMVTDSANQVIDSLYSNIAITSLYNGTSGGVLNNLGANVGIDDGTALPAATSEQIFGLAIDQVQLTDNQSSVSAGNSQATEATYFIAKIPTVAILPRGAVAGNPVAGLGIAGTDFVDARGYTRHTTGIDIGAVETVAVIFDANTGSWNGLPTNVYDGTIYYESTDPTVIYTVTGDGNTIMIRDDANLTCDDGAIFLGWNTAADGSGTWYQAGDTFTVDLDVVTLFAQWDEAAEESSDNNTDSSENNTTTTNNENELPVTGQNTLFILLAGVILVGGSTLILRRKANK